MDRAHLGLERDGTPEAYFTYGGEPLLSFGGLSDFIFYAGRGAYDYQRWADWAVEHGMNHVRAYIPTSWRYIEQFVEDNDGGPEDIRFPYEEVEPGSRQFDLTRQNDAYWDRFRHTCEYLEDRGIVVHLLLYNGWHLSDIISSGSDLNWGGHFFNPKNNVNAFTDHLADDQFRFYFSVADGRENIVATQADYLRRAITETASLGNVYYDLVHELHPSMWLSGYEDGRERLREWIAEMARTLRERWREIDPGRPCILGLDTSFMDLEEVDWVLDRPYFDLAIYGRVHRYERAKAWREIYEKPYVGQESIDDTGDKYSLREPNQHVHIRKYLWKFVLAKCQQLDVYTKERAESMSPNVGVTHPPGLPHDYDPRGWNEFEDDAPVLRSFWESLVDYPNLWFDGTVTEGPGAHQYVLSSEREAVAYCSSASTAAGVEYGASTLELGGLATADGTAELEIVDPSAGVTDTRTATVRDGEASVALPAFTDDVAVHLWTG